MKKSDLKELIREEIRKALSEDSQNIKDQLPTEPGKYKVEYIVADSDGGPDYPGSAIVDISQNGIDMGQDTSPSNFWRGEARSAEGFNIYKVEKVTKL